MTQATGTDTARVAKFGVSITANGQTFAEAYNTHDANYVSAFAQSVLSGEKVVAPGTSGSMASMTLSGQPEVGVKVTYVADFALSDNWTVEGGKFYCPLIIVVEGTEVNGLGYTSKADFEAAVEGLINGWTKSYEPGTILGEKGADSVSVSWVWPFSTSDDNDAKDTWLGNQAAAGNAATVSLTITTTVTQVD